MKYAHNIVKSNNVICTYYSDESDGNPYLQAHEAGCTCTTVEHSAEAFVYEMVDGVIKVVTMEDMYTRLNDPNDKTVVTPTIE